jgi:hypothetical protein
MLIQPAEDDLFDLLKSRIPMLIHSVHLISVLLIDEVFIGVPIFF